MEGGREEGRDGRDGKQLCQVDRNKGLLLVMCLMCLYSYK